MLHRALRIARSHASRQNQVARYFAADSNGGPTGPDDKQTPTQNPQNTQNTQNTQNPPKPQRQFLFGVGKGPIKPKINPSIAEDATEARQNAKPEAHAQKKPLIPRENAKAPNPKPAVHSNQGTQIPQTNQNHQNRPTPQLLLNRQNPQNQQNRQLLQNRPNQPKAGEAPKKEKIEGSKSADPIDYTSKILTFPKREGEW
jgi:hypothetical protein